ncbi:Chalcone synthase [Rhynchospora pubera]|uniref:chalcone synthase n=2 Tax=Rhynchospora pubera TaxID=906938 RepID=A0AAV8FSS0_9POAL|nr:Chalcone synthase [Rhynchospora pubera]
MDPAQQRSQGFATVLAVGTAVPPQKITVDYMIDNYFRVTNTEHLTELQKKFAKICKATTIQSKYLYATEELLKEHPNIAACMSPSLDDRLDVLVDEVPKLGKEASLAAIKEWGHPISKITHLIFTTNSGADCPGADSRLVHLLGLSPNVNRIMLYYQGCHAGASTLRLAKDIAENNRGARILIVTSENILHAFRGPDEAHADFLVSQALFSDGAAAVIVGADPDLEVERPLFEIISARETLILNTMEELGMQLREVGNLIFLSPTIPKHISANIEGCLLEAFKPLGITDWNSIFWVSHPGGPAILNQVEAKLKLNKDKLSLSRKVLSEYGNLSSPTVLFILNELRKESVSEGKSTTGNGFEYGVLLGFGPGLSIETVVLRSVPI